MPRTKTFIVRLDAARMCKRLKNEELGILFRALIETAEGIQPEELPETETAGILYELMAAHILQDQEDYEKRCETNRQNQLKRWGKQ